MTDSDTIYKQAANLDSKVAARDAFGVISAVQKLPKSRSMFACATALVALCDDGDLDAHQFITYANNFVTKAAEKHPEFMAIQDTLKELLK